MFLAAMTKSDALLNRLKTYCPNALPMHMPGHKRNVALAPYLKELGAGIDITEIDGFDDLHAAEGVLADGMDRAARLWGAKQSFFCVNGSTGGLLASVFALAEDGDEIICARNCHKAVYNALRLRRAKPHFLFPKQEKFSGTDCIVTPGAVAEMMDLHPAAKVVIITSPTYEGVVSDVTGIAAAVHERGGVLMVDEAHGAHLGFGAGFPKGAVKSGADLVVQSLHKTLPGLTQTAIVHACSERIDLRRLAENLAVFESSSPSYLLMASIDSCVGLLKDEGEMLFTDWQHGLNLFKEKTDGIKHLKLMRKTAEMYALDPSKLVVSTRGTSITGRGLMRCLRAEFSIEMEMAAADYAVAMSGMGDTESSFAEFAEALCTLDGRLESAETVPTQSMAVPKRACYSWEAEVFRSEPVSLNDAPGRVSAEYVWAYPPGIPLLIPGEIIEKGFADLVLANEKAEISMKSSFSQLPQKIYVIKGP